MAASPSEFLTFYRRIATTNALRQASVARPAAARQFHASIRATVGDHMDDKTHTTRKTDQLDIQNDASQKGMGSKKGDTGGVATRQKDEHGGAAQIKSENPEAPDTIGMQDERGSKGH